MAVAVRVRWPTEKKYGTFCDSVTCAALTVPVQPVLPLAQKYVGAAAVLVAFQTPSTTVGVTLRPFCVTLC